METEDLFRVEFSEDGSLGVEFSEDFLSSSQEEQIQALEAFFWRKTLEPSPTLEVNKAMTEHEITIIVAETILAKLKRGERLERDSNIDISWEELSTLGNIQGSVVVADMARYLEQHAEGKKGCD
ncbi:MAG: hypothetical protein JW883_01220 [Deltaproteobacteria bacterium]|nr:hypothetical protein [Deltaproteobacteria bacterium]